MPVEDSDGILDLAQLEMATGGDRALMSELIGLYLADTDARLPGLVEAARAAELQQVGRVAHGLKGASAALGLSEAAGAFRRLEELGRSGEADRLDEALADAQDAWRRACARLRDLAA